MAARQTRPTKILKIMSRTDSIHLRGLRLKCRIGVSAAERRRPQLITAAVTLQCDLKKAGKSDDLADTVDYSTLAKKIGAAAKAPCCLLETLASRIAATCLADSRVKAVTVKAAKQSRRPNGRSMEIEITRRRDFNMRINCK